jgi:hypothetical protein
MGGEPDPQRCEEFIAPILRKMEMDGGKPEEPKPAVPRKRKDLRGTTREIDGFTVRFGDGEETALGRKRGVNPQEGWRSGVIGENRIQEVETQQSIFWRLLLRQMRKRPELKALIDKALMSPDTYKHACPGCKKVGKHWCCCVVMNKILEKYAYLVKAQRTGVNLFSGGGSSVQERKIK